MKCPYAINMTKVTQVNYEYDVESKETFRECVEKEYDNFVPCLETNCAVFYDGKCHYNG